MQYEDELKGLDVGRRHSASKTSVGTNRKQSEQNLYRNNNYGMNRFLRGSK